MGWNWVTHTSTLGLLLVPFIALVLFSPSELLHGPIYSYIALSLDLHYSCIALGQYHNILEPCFLTLYLFLSSVNAFSLLLFDFVLLSYCIIYLQYLITICFLFVLSNGRKRRHVIALVELNYLTSPMCKLMGKQ